MWTLNSIWFDEKYFFWNIPSNSFAKLKQFRKNLENCVIWMKTVFWQYRKNSHIKFWRGCEISRLIRKYFNLQLLGNQLTSHMIELFSASTAQILIHSNKLSHKKALDLHINKNSNNSFYFLFMLEI